MSNEINEYDEFERKLKMVHRSQDLKNQNVIQDIINQKKSEGSFKELYLKKKRRNFIFKVSSISFAVVFFAVFSALLLKDVIFAPSTTVEPVPKSILKASYHIAYFEDIEIIDKLSKDLNLSENEYAKFIFYSPDDVGKEILIKKDSISLQPKYITVEFKKLGYIFGISINSFLKDTNQNKRLIIAGNMPETPKEYIENRIKQSLITKEQFILLSKNNNLDVNIILKGEPNREIKALMSKFEKNNIKYEIIK